VKAVHLALIVEDDSATAEDLTEILRSIGCDSKSANNKRDALALLRNNHFCIILLDLEIKSQLDSIKGHTAHGTSLLREIRQEHADHAGLSYWLPILIVSGFAREVSTAVEVMQEGADGVIHKPCKTQEVSEGIRRALERSGRTTHQLCGEKPAPRTAEAGKGVVLSIPGDRVRRRTRVMVGSRPIMLTNSSLGLLLQLMVAHRKGRAVHKRDLGASDDQGFKGVSVLREALRPVLGEGVDIIDNDYHGFYRLKDNVIVGECDVDNLVRIGDTKISDLARNLRGRYRDHPNSEGNT
jgi:DNA-binding response OmpR family regulator